MGGYEDVSTMESKLAEEVNEAILHSAFIPFGDIEDVKTLLDQATQKHRSFGFVTFLEHEDAATAMDNMDGAELYGRILTVNYALPKHSQRRERRASGVRGRDGADPVAFLEIGESFWVMRNDRRQERWLPGFFDREVYEILDGAAELEVERTTKEEEEGKKPLMTKRENHLSILCIRGKARRSMDKVTWFMREEQENGMDFMADLRFQSHAVLALQEAAEAAEASVRRRGSARRSREEEREMALANGCEEGGGARQRWGTGNRGAGMRVERRRLESLKTTSGRRQAARSGSGGCWGGGRRRLGQG